MPRRLVASRQLLFWTQKIFKKEEDDTQIQDLQSHGLWSQTMPSLVPIASCICRQMDLRCMTMLTRPQPAHLAPPRDYTGFCLIIVITKTGQPGRAPGLMVPRAQRVTMTLMLRICWMTRPSLGNAVTDR